MNIVAGVFLQKGLNSECSWESFQRWLLSLSLSKYVCVSTIGYVSLEIPDEHITCQPSLYIGIWIFILFILPPQCKTHEGKDFYVFFMATFIIWQESVKTKNAWDILDFNNIIHVQSFWSLFKHIFCLLLWIIQLYV